jgi:hypothetical protein
VNVRAQWLSWNLPKRHERSVFCIQNTIKLFSQSGAGATFVSTGTRRARRRRNSRRWSRCR